MEVIAYLEGFQEKWKELKLNNKIQKKMSWKKQVRRKSDLGFTCL